MEFTSTLEANRSTCKMVNVISIRTLDGLDVGLDGTVKEKKILTTNTI